VALGGGSLGVIGILAYLAIVLVGARHHTLSALDGVTISSPRVTASSILDTDCRHAVGPATRRDCAIVGDVDAAQSYWQSWFAARGRPYRRAGTAFFSGLIGTGCGAASADVGPFYCPADGRIYIDLGFFQALESRSGGRDAPAAEAYVIGHELGHHVQELLSELSGDPTAVELQADCYAGVWMRHAARARAVGDLTAKQVDAALDATSAVGGERVHAEAEHELDAESWNWGTPAERRSAFLRGYRAAAPPGCARPTGAVGSPP
jgi:predicted metalloprotease